ncbi:unnamed protein product [Protopolystoma xenopodis]|uniref:Uncharacterized protein n=1 Tax=Protopolystoma xenopodis TaxID=117903 RepID=A0A448WTR0_9PLAT|nr:unnamed protein product [Protopolystoma xenopodis]
MSRAEAAQAVGDPLKRGPLEGRDPVSDVRPSENWVVWPPLTRNKARIVCLCVCLLSRFNSLGLSTLWHGNLSTTPSTIPIWLVEAVARPVSQSIGGIYANKVQVLVGPSSGAEFPVLPCCKDPDFDVPTF